MLISSEGNFVIANEHRELVNVLYNAIQRDQTFRRQLKKLERSGERRLAGLIREFTNANSRLIYDLRRLLYERVENRTTGQLSVKPNESATGGSEHGCL